MNNDTQTYQIVNRKNNFGLIIEFYDSFGNKIYNPNSYSFNLNKKENEEKNLIALCLINHNRQEIVEAVNKILKMQKENIY